jgi:hypothetical protein
VRSATGTVGTFERFKLRWANFYVRMMPREMYRSGFRTVSAASICRTASAARSSITANRDFISLAIKIRQGHRVEPLAEECSRARLRRCWQPKPRHRDNRRRFPHWKQMPTRTLSQAQTCEKRFVTMEGSRSAARQCQATPEVARKNAKPVSSQRNDCGSGGRAQTSEV